MKIENHILNNTKIAEVVSESPPSASPEPLNGYSEVHSKLTVRMPKSKLRVGVTSKLL
jgi:hypothetical protein